MKILILILIQQVIKILRESMTLPPPIQSGLLKCLKIGFHRQMRLQRRISNAQWIRKSTSRLINAW